MGDEYDMYLEGEESSNNSSSDRDIDVTDPSTNESSKGSISKSTMIADIIDRHPEVVPMLMDQGIHCVGCGGSSFETLEEGFMGHGIPDDEIDRIIEDLNAIIRDNKQ